MSEVQDILNPQYWADRLAKAVNGDLHHAIYKCPLEVWRKVENRHREIIALTIKDNESVLDCGCGWGRLLELMPPTWRGNYLGFDLSPDFISAAEANYPRRAGRAFQVRDALSGLPASWTNFFDWAVLISVRPMVIRNLGQGAWDRMEVEVRRCARRILYLEYDMDDGGSIE